MSLFNTPYLTVNLEDEMKMSYLDYAMSVIVGRALPEVKDGLKPVQRRILYAMFREGLLSDKKYSKCAGVVGEVLKKYHPHGDSAVYDTLVRLAQDFNMRYVLIDGQGNFGSIDGDPAAAYRYTEARLSKIAEEFLEDIDKDTVDFRPNFDETTEEPIVLPTKIPNLIINGSTGIAVGMATSIPPHNLTEVIDALIKIIDNPDVSIDEIMTIIEGPDFPTGARIHGKEGIRSAYTTGKGIIKVRAKAVIIDKDKGSGSQIIIKEIPYQVDKSKLVESIADLVREKRLEGISAIRDESSKKEGIRIVIEIKRGELPEIILNNLYKHTQLETSFSIIMLALVDGQPKILNLKEILTLFLKHRHQVIIRRTRFDLKNAIQKAHILEGLKIALDHLDEIISIIRGASTPDEAKTTLIGRFSLTDIQAKAILDMRLQRLTGLERSKIIKDLQDTMLTIDDLKDILARNERVVQIIKTELEDIKRRFGDERRTEIVPDIAEITPKDIIPNEDMVITITKNGYIKRTPVAVYRQQQRAGVGTLGVETSDEDYVEHLMTGPNHDYILLFSNKGIVYSKMVYEIEEAGRQSKGKHIKNLIENLQDDERITTAFNVSDFKDGYLVLFTKNGTVKKTALSEFSNIRKIGIRAITLDENDELISVRKTDGSHDIIIATKKGLAKRFHEDNIRATGRTSMGVRGIKLASGDVVVSADIIEDDSTLLTVTENGLGKRTRIEEYPRHNRGGKGVKSIKVTAKGGDVVGVIQVKEDDKVILMSSSKKLIKLAASDIKISGRDTQGVRLMGLKEDQKLVAIARVVEKEENNNNDESSIPYEQ
ncbi:MAG: DNA gyrase subunit A [Thermodesulfovibrionales bacterium]|nr:DNA gyrase subunit A [Thermodesulfovibrionales bacterium]